MAGFYISPVWDHAVGVVEQGNLQPLIEALRKEPMPQRAQEYLALVLSRVTSLKFKRPAHRPRMGASRAISRLQGEGLLLWAADRDVRRIKAAWKDPAAARELAASDLELWDAANAPNIGRRVPEAVGIAARHHGVDQQKFINWRRRGPRDRRRS